MGGDEEMELDESSSKRSLRERSKIVKPEGFDEGLQIRRSHPWTAKEDKLLLKCVSSRNFVDYADLLTKFPKDFAECRTPKTLETHYHKLLNEQKAKKEKKAKAKANEPLYCICKSPYDPEIFMIECSSCQDWFHGDCVHVTEEDAEDIDDYVCPNCARSDQSRRHSQRVVSPAKRVKQEKSSHCESTSPSAQPQHHDHHRHMHHRQTSKPTTTTTTSHDVEEARSRVRMQLLKALSKDEKSERVTSLADSIEGALWSKHRHVIKDVRNAARALQFNISRNDSLYESVISGNITPVELINLSHEDLAIPEMKQWIKNRKEHHFSTEVIKDDGDALPSYKQLEETVVPPNVPPLKEEDGGEGEGLPDPDEFTDAMSGGNPTTTTTTTTTPSTSLDSFLPAPTTVGGGSSSSSSSSSLKSRTLPSNSFSSSRVNIGTSWTDVPHSTPEQMAESVWSGMIDCGHGDVFRASCLLLSGERSSLLHVMNTVLLKVVGRLEVGKLDSYFEDINTSKSRRVHVVRFAPNSEDDRIPFLRFCEMFARKDRAAVVFQDKLKEMYLVPHGEYREYRASSEGEGEEGEGQVRVMQVKELLGYVVMKSRDEIIKSLEGGHSSSGSRTSLRRSSSSSTSSLPPRKNESPDRALSSSSSSPTAPPNASTTSITSSVVPHPPQPPSEEEQERVPIPAGAEELATLIGLVGGTCTKAEYKLILEVKDQLNQLSKLGNSGPAAAALYSSMAALTPAPAPAPTRTQPQPQPQPQPPADAPTMDELRQRLLRAGGGGGGGR